MSGIDNPGYLALDFIRESDSAFDVMESASANVKSVLAKTELIHVSPDLVGIKELANIFECTRQNIQKFVSKPTFPIPVYKGSQTIWHLATVLDWFIVNGHEINQELLELAELTVSLNSRIENQAAKPQVLNQARSLVIA